MTWAEVRLWGRTIGAVSMADTDAYASFEYDPAFAGSGIEVSPLAMPLDRRVYSFPALAVGPSTDSLDCWPIPCPTRSARR